jgi:acyl carrier protein
VSHLALRGVTKRYGTTTSVDAIDLAVELQALTGVRVAEVELKKLRTVGDVCDLVERLRGTG